MRGGRTLAQDSMGLFWDIFDLHTGHGAIMALEAPVHNRVAVGRARRRSAMRPARGPQITRLGEAQAATPGDALERWLQRAGVSPAASRLVVPSGSLPELLRTALAPLRPALDTAERRAPARQERTGEGGAERQEPAQRG